MPTKRQPKAQAAASASEDAVMEDVEVAAICKDSHVFDQGYHSQPGTSYPSPKESFAAQSNAPPTIIENLGRPAKQLVHAVNKLEHAGVEASGLPLPKIVAIGDQSAGKSSLIEAISGIKVPRAAGTCTRCPLQISLVEDEVASWKVTVHRKYQYLGNSNHDNDFGPWQLMSKPEDVASVQLSSAEEVEEAIRNAQKAVLSPRDDPSKVLKGAKPNLSLEFSPDVVKIDLTGPRLPTLTLYDLPGIIAQASNDQNGFLPKMIKALATQHISNENTIVMLACQVGSDFQNSNAAALVHRLHAEDRTVGVITKADKLTPEEANQWLELLEANEGSFKIAHGFFVTKQPSHDELKSNISHADARGREVAFFRENSLWNSTAFARFQGRYGTTKLQDTLAKLLADEILRGLPSIERKIDQRLGTVIANLLDYPPPQENPVRVVSDIIGQIRQHVARLTVGVFPHRQLILTWREKAKAYKKELSSMEPIVVMATGPEAHWPTPPAELISLDSDDDAPEEASVPGSGKRSMAPPHTPTKKQRQASSRPERSELARKFFLEEIRTTIRDRTTSELPGASGECAEEALIEESRQHWKMPLVKFLGEMRVVIKGEIMDATKQALNRWASTPLAVETERAVQSYLDQINDDLKKKCLLYLEAELDKPLTFSEDIHEHYRRTNLAYFRDHRKLARQKAYVRAQGGRRFEEDELDRKAKAVKDTTLLDDPYAAEVELMARVRGYYHTAASSIVDSVCKTMHYEVFVACRQDLADDLQDKLGVHRGDVLDTCTRLVAQDPAREVTRMALETEKGKLESAKMTLMEMKY